MDFSHKTFRSNTHFGAGKISVLDELIQPFRKIMLIAGGSADKLAAELASRWRDTDILRFSKIIQHVPEELVRQALYQLQQHDSQLLLAIGGGSSIGLAKALALETRLPIFAVPSTFAGSEQTDIWGITSDNNKKTGRSELVVPAVVVYDPELTATLPKLLAVTSAMNAMAHLMEATYSPLGNPVTSHVALLGMKSIAQGLEAIGANPKFPMEVNEKLLFGAYLGGRCLSEVPMALHHKAAHVLGGSFNLDHAGVHTALQPHVLAYQWPYLGDEVRDAFANATGSQNPPLALKNLATDCGVSTDLQALGFQKADINAAAKGIVATPFPNPAPVSFKGVKKLLEDALHGHLPPLP